MAELEELAARKQSKKHLIKTCTKYMRERLEEGKRSCIHSCTGSFVVYLCSNNACMPMVAHVLLAVVRCRFCVTDASVLCRESRLGEEGYCFTPLGLIEQAGMVALDAMGLPSHAPRKPGGTGRAEGHTHPLEEGATAGRFGQFCVQSPQRLCMWHTHLQVCQCARN